TRLSGGKCSSNQFRTSALKVSCSGLYWKSMAHPSFSFPRFSDSPIPRFLLPRFLLCWLCGSPILRFPDSWLPEPGEHLLPQPLDTLQHLFGRRSQGHATTQDKPLDPQRGPPAVELLQPVRRCAEDHVLPDFCYGEVRFRAELCCRHQHPPAEVELAFFHPQTTKCLFGLLQTGRQPAITQKGNTRGLASLERGLPVNVELGFERIEGIEKRRHRPDVTKAAGAGDRLGPERANPNRWMRPLIRLGGEVDRVVMIILAVVSARPGDRPRLAHHLQALLEPPFALPDRHAAVIEVARMVANAETQDQASTRQQVDHRCLLGKVNRVIEWRPEHVGAKLHSLCPRGERCEQRERRREHTLGPGVALGHEHPIEAIALGLLS